MPWNEDLTVVLGTPLRVCALESSPRSRVWRVDLAERSVVVKQLAEGPGYAREVAALRLVSTVDPPVTPRLLGVVDGERALVLEHVVHRPPADDWVIDYARTLARLHSAGPDRTGVLPAWSGPGRRDVAAFLGLAEEFGCVVPAGVEAELDALTDRLAIAGRSLLHGDPCPGNDLHTAEGVRFVDFEQAAVGNGIVELAYLRVGFPSCWCATRVPDPLLAAAEAAYRETWLAATGTEVEGDPVDACAG